MRPTGTTDLLAAPPSSPTPPPPTWTELLPPEAPSAQYYSSALAYDSATQQTLYFQETPTRGLQWIWSFSSDSWTNVTPSGGLVDQGLQAVTSAFDTALGGLVLLGFPSLGNPETWEYQGGLWTEMNPTNEPYGVVLAGMTYDAGNASLLLLTMITVSGTVQTLTWTFQSGDWTVVATSGSPPPLQGTMTFDNATLSRRVLLFDYHYSPNRTETWTYTNGTWTNVTGSSGPEPPASTAVAVYDAADQFVLLLSAVLPTGRILKNTWEYANGTWILANPPSTAPFGSPAALTYDGHDGFPILVQPWPSLTTNMETTVVWKFDHTALGNPPTAILMVTPTKPSADHTIHVVASVVGGYGVVGVGGGIEAPGCQLFEHALGEWNCTPNAGGQGFALLSVTDQAGRVNLTYVKFNVTAPPLLPAWAWYAMGGAAGAAIAAAALIVVYRRRRGPRRPDSPPGEPEATPR
jgi:hypothetical protein